MTVGELIAALEKLEALGRACDPWEMESRAMPVPAQLREVLLYWFGTTDPNLIAEAMELREGHKCAAAKSIKDLRHGCLAALGYLGGVSILSKEQLQKVLADAVKASGSEEKWSSA